MFKLKLKQLKKMIKSHNKLFPLKFNMMMQVQKKISNRIDHFKINNKLLNKQFINNKLIYNLNKFQCNLHNNKFNNNQNNNKKLQIQIF